MAVRAQRSTRPESHGVGAWVTRDEVRRVVAELAELERLADLHAWGCRRGSAAATSRFWPVLAFRLDPAADRPLQDEDRDEVAALVVRELAVGACRRAIRARAAERRLSVPHAVGALGASSMARCPVCDGSVNVRDTLSLYCPAHHEDERADVARLLENS